MAKPTFTICLLCIAGIFAGCVSDRNQGPGQSTGKVQLPDGSYRRIVHEIQPSFPSSARWKSRTGTVIMRVWIAPEGTVQKAEARYASDTALIAAVKTAVEQWRFAPAAEGDRRVLTAEIPFTLSLDSPKKKQHP